MVCTGNSYIILGNVMCAVVCLAAVTFFRCLALVVRGSRRRGNNLLEVPGSLPKPSLDGDSSYTDEAAEPDSEQSFDGSDKGKDRVYHNERKRVEDVAVKCGLSSEGLGRTSPLLWTLGSRTCMPQP